MIAFPEVQRRAQAEADAVVGRDRLPTFADTPHLLYVCAKRRNDQRKSLLLSHRFRCLTPQPEKTGTKARTLRKGTVWISRKPAGPGTRQPEAFVLRGGQQVLSSSQRAIEWRCQHNGIQFTWGMLTSKREMGKETASLNSRTSRLAVLGVKDDRSCKLWRKGPRCLHPYSTGSVKFLRVALKRIRA